MGEGGVEGGVSHGNFGLLVELAQELLYYGEEVVDVAAGFVLHLDFETVGDGVTGDHRRREHHDAAILDRGGLDGEASDEVVDTLLAFRPVFELDNHSAVGGACAGHEGVTGDGFAQTNGGFFQHEFFHLVDDLLGALLGGAGGHVNHGEEHAGVFVRHHSRRCGRHQPAEEDNRDGHSAEGGDFVACHKLHTFLIFIEQFFVAGFECFVEALAEEAEHGQQGYDHSHGAEHHVLKREPVEHHEYDGGDEQQQGNQRREVHAEAAGEALLNHFAGGGVGLAHAFFEGGIGVMRLEEQGAQCGRQGQGVYGGEADGDGHGQTELLVEDTGGAGHERHGDEHQHHYQGDGNQRTGNFVHGIDGGATRGGVALVQLGVDGFNHHNGVVDYNRDGQYQSGKSDEVDGEADDAQHGECTNQGHRDGDGRDEGGAEVLQEDVYHKEYEHECFDEGADYVVDGGEKELVVVHRHIVFEAFGQVGFQFFNHCQAVVDNLGGVGARGLEHDGHGRYVAV